ncbi:MAG: helix-turn-helix transcriptional regulator [Bacteroidota bacterium]
MRDFGFVDIVLFLGVSQGLFLSVAFRLIHNRNKSANSTLSYLLLIAALMLLGRIAAFRIPEDWVWRFGVLIDTTIFLFGPFVYTYVRRLVFNETPTFRLKWWHYLPALIHLCYYVWTLSIPLLDFNEMYFSGRLNLLFFIVEAGGLISFIFYWVKTFFLLKKYAIEEGKQLSYKPAVNRFLMVFTGVLALFIILWLVSFLSTNFLGRPFVYVNYVTMWITTPVFIYVVGYFSLRQPEIFRIPLPPKSKSDSERLKPNEIHQFQKRLHFFMEEEKIYMEPNLSLKSLADKINTSSNNLSWLLNQVYQASFYEYINNYRIKAFREKVERNEHNSQTLLALALDVGFNSKSTFNRVFKSVMGITPKEYLKTKKVA